MMNIQKAVIARAKMCETDLDRVTISLYCVYEICLMLFSNKHTSKTLSITIKIISLILLESLSITKRI